MTERINAYVETMLRANSIKLGAPTKTSPYGAEMLYIPYQPHVFLFKDAYILQPQHQIDSLRGKIPYIDQGDKWEQITPQTAPALHLRNLVGMLGHGFVSGPNVDDWFFPGTGKSIDSTVRDYEQVAETGLLPHLDIIVACKTPRPKGVNFSVSMRKRPYISSGDTITISSPLAMDENNPFKYAAQLLPGKGAVAVMEADHWFNIDKWMFNNDWLKGTSKIHPDMLPDWCKNKSQV